MSTSLKNHRAEQKVYIYASIAFSILIVFSVFLPWQKVSQRESIGLHITGSYRGIDASYAPYGNTVLIMGIICALSSVFYLVSRNKAALNIYILLAVIGACLSIILILIFYSNLGYWPAIGLWLSFLSFVCGSITSIKIKSN